MGVLGLFLLCMCKWRFWRGGGGGGGGFEEVKGAGEEGVHKLCLVELVCGKHGNCWSEEGTG